VTLSGVPVPRVRAVSLRVRLFALIVLPLVLVAVAAGAVRYSLALDLSQRLYDETLKVVAHAVAREVVLTQGDVLADALAESLVGALGDPIFYRVSAADGRLITGYTDAPVPPGGLDLPGGQAVFFSARYNGRAVRAVVMREFISDPEFDGWTTVQVWQTVSRREELGARLLLESAVLLAAVLGAAAVLVWIGITLGLRPLTDLRDAVARRTEHDLQPIRRPVPPEAVPLVATINALFARLTAEFDRRDAFIGLAAHQLRNPVAAIQAQAEAALAAPDPADRTARLRDLTAAAGRLSRITRQLLRHDRATQAPGAGDGRVVAPQADLAAVAAEVTRRHALRAVQAGVELSFDAAPGPLPVAADPVLLAEAVDNLIDNALNYGAARGGMLAVAVCVADGQASLSVTDTGPGIPDAAREAVFDRFVRLAEDGGQGCGLGLPIARAIARAAGGDLILDRAWSQGCRMRLDLPLKAPARAG
jgi:two-component system, OmpR family, sensor histidine kinase TctE